MCDRGPQLAAEAGWTVSLQHVSISGYLLGAVIEPPSNAQHWITAESRVGAATVWRRNPAGEVSIIPPGRLRRSRVGLYARPRAKNRACVRPPCEEPYLHGALESSLVFNPHSAIF